MRFCDYTLSDMIILGMIIRFANAAALSSRAATGVMLLEASCALDGF
jgi:hypothetical protein